MNRNMPSLDELLRRLKKLEEQESWSPLTEDERLTKEYIEEKLMDWSTDVDYSY